MPNKNFTQFNFNSSATSADHLVGYNSGGTNEFRTTIGALLSSNKQNIAGVNLGYQTDQTPVGNYSFTSGRDCLASGPYTHAEGFSTSATSMGLGSSHAEGLQTLASGQASHAEGYLTKALANYAHAEGQQTFASNVASHAEGVQTTASGANSHAQNFQTTASGENSHAEGSYGIASGLNSHVEGYQTRASGPTSHAEGSLTVAAGIFSHAAGYRATAAQNYTYAWSDGNLTTLSENVSTTRSGQYMVSASGGMFIPGNVGIGTDNNTNGLTIVGTISGNNPTTSFNLGSATGSYSFAVGSGKAADLYCHAEGANTFASNVASHAEGSGTISYGGFGSHAEGLTTTASGSASHAEGNQTLASGYYSHAEGGGTVASAQGSHAEGNQTLASGMNSHAQGFQTIASGAPSHAEGSQTRASGASSHAEGRQTVASGSYTHAEGYATSATSAGVHASSHAEGRLTLASGQASHAEGIQTIASGNYSHAQGFQTIASGSNSDATGSSTIASGNGSTACGFRTIAAGGNSFAGGTYSAAMHDYTYVWGGAPGLADYSLSSTRTSQYMVSAPGGVFIPGNVGIGVDCFSENLSGNALTVFSSSNNDEWYSAALTVTQLGSAFAFRVNDSSGGDPSSFIIDNGGNTYIGVGSNTPQIYRNLYGNNRDYTGPKLAVFGGIVAGAVQTNRVADPNHPDIGLYGPSFAFGGKGSNSTGCQALAPASFCQGADTTCLSTAIAAHAEGGYTVASGQFSHAEGELTAANGLASHAEGFQTTASADYSHAEGDQTHAEGEASHAEGGQTTASGDASHAEGSSTIASGSVSHAEGYNTRASGTASHAAGYRVTAAQDYTYAWSDGNLGTATANVSTTRSGQYMVSASGGMFVPGNVGIGTDNNTNALTVAGTISANQPMKFSSTATAPSNTSTPAAWMDVYVNNTLYKLPLYQ